MRDGIVIKNRKDVDTTQYGLVCSLRNRSDNKVMYHRTFNFKNEIYGLLQLCRYISALKLLENINPKEHYVEIKPSQTYKTPKWLLKRLNDMGVVKEWS